jgi:hypothetical protein
MNGWLYCWVSFDSRILDLTCVGKSYFRRETKVHSDFFRYSILEKVGAYGQKTISHPSITFPFLDLSF